MRIRFPAAAGDSSTRAISIYYILKNMDKRVRVDGTRFFSTKRRTPRFMPMKLLSVIH